MANGLACLALLSRDGFVTYRNVKASEAVRNEREKGLDEMV
jgi:hypothetical protein